ncbi:MAG: penicillin-binding protein 2 [Rhabdochlamydiaceae bacterium]|nr:penicillin-binding protein 2 [Rhabdochlamydiaceae bacterium]
MSQLGGCGVPSPEARKRLVWVSLSVILLFCALLVQFYKIQILEGDHWTRVAKAQHQLLITEPFKRGLFYSNTALKPGHPEMPQALVADVPKFHLFADPKSLPSEVRDEVAKKLRGFLSLDDQDYQRLRSQFDKQSRSRKLVMWMSRDRRDTIAAWWFEYARQKKIPRNALFFVQDYKRSYPFGKLLGQVLHTVREERDAKSQQCIPTGGLEFVFDRVLQGKEGKRQILRSPRHPLETGKILAVPEDGADVYLTVNHYLQAIAEEEIEKAVKNANAKGGWAILMHPRTGEIYALAQYPGFDPGEYRKYFNDPKLHAHTKIQAITDPFEPGSTMKPLTVAIALKANKELIKRGKKPLFSPLEKIHTGQGVFPGRTKPISDTRRHEYLNMYMALQKSSNIYVARLVQRIIEHLGESWYREALANVFGFGQKTGIELPSESPGLLPMPGKLNPNGTLEWSTPTPFSMAFGHNLLINSLQLVRSYGILANGGYDVRPTLIRKVVRTHRDGSQEILLDNTHPERVNSYTRVLDEDIVKDVVKAMKYVTKPGGSAAKGDIFGYTEVGKTGTTEKIVNGTYSKRDHISTFIGFAPAKDPQFVLMIAIDEPEYKYIPNVGRNQMGGNCAAPAFRELGQRALQYLGVAPDDPFGYPAGDPRRDESKADWFQECQTLKELYQRWNP